MRLPIRSLGVVSPSSPSILALVNAIQQQEGPVRNNNPGNLVYVGQPGATGADSRGFAIFPTMASGQQAEAEQIALDVSRGSCATGSPVNSLTDLIAGCLTPASLNPNVGSYVQAVAAQTGIDPSADLGSQLGAGVSALPVALADGSSQSPDASFAGILGIDLTDPTTLLILALGGGVMWWAFSK